MAGAKQQLDLGWSGSLAESHDDFWDRLNRPDQRIDYKEGVASFVERRPARFPPLGPRD